MNKKLTIVAAILLALVLLIGGMFAYFTDYQTKTNVFTLGKGSDITLTEPGFDGLTAEQKELVPLKEITKDPTITVGANSGDVYAFVKVVIPYQSVKTGSNTTAQPTELFTFTKNTGWEQVSRTVGTDTVTYILSYSTSTNMTPLHAGDSVTAFNKVTFADITDPTEVTLNASDNLEIEITGYAIQTDLNGIRPANDLVWSYFAVDGIN